MRSPRRWPKAPASARLLIAPGNPGTEALGRNVPVDISDNAALCWLAKRENVDLVVIGPEAPLVAGLVDDLTRVGVLAFGPTAAAAQLEGSKGFTKDLCREFAHSDRRLRPLLRPQSRAGPSGRRCAAGRHQGRRARVRQGRGHRDYDGGSRIGARLDVRGRLRGGRRLRGDRGVSRRRGNLVLRLVRWREGAAARLGHGPQAGRRGRHRPQYRRHGRHLAGSRHDAGARGPHHARDRRADAGRDAGPRHPIQGRACSPV